MAVLTEVDRVALHAAMMRELSANLDPLGALSKADLRAAIDAADSWADANAASYNTALPVAARTILTAKQKALVLMYVIRQRHVRA